jgi:RNA polymerase sigma-70 factor, ECF subfamily
LIDDWYGRIFAYCQSRLRIRSDAEDAAQETFVRALANIHRFNEANSQEAWLRTIAHHVCVDLIRRKSVRQAASIDVDHLTNPPIDNDIDIDQQQQIVNMIHSLDEPLREVILLHYYEELTYDQIASWLGVARSTVNERLSKARQSLRFQIIQQEKCHAM